MFAVTTSVVLVGVQPRLVRVEAHVTGGDKASIVIVGLPDTAVREARERVRAAILSTGFSLPNRRVIVNLSPADVRKSGSAYDLPIALAVLAAAGDIAPLGRGVVSLGELALNGEIRKARGGFAAAVVAARSGLPCILPPEAAAEGATQGGADVLVVRNLAEAIGVLCGSVDAERARPRPVARERPPDLDEVRGQQIARRALEVAAAGGHHLLLSGAPGAGKTMLARCLPGILPELTTADSHEVSLVWAAAGRPRPDSVTPPFRSPHHSASVAALVGGGSGMPVPGEASLAHRGVLFLDELGEFPPQALDALRQPVEDGGIVVARKGASVRFPDIDPVDRCHQSMSVRLFRGPARLNTEERTYIHATKSRTHASSSHNLRNVPEGDDPLVQSLAAAVGWSIETITSRGRDQLTVAARELAAVGATPGQVLGVAAQYRQKWPHIEITPMALAKWWPNFQRRAGDDTCSDGSAHRLEWRADSSRGEDALEQCVGCGEWRTRNPDRPGDALTAVTFNAATGAYDYLDVHPWTNPYAVDDEPSGGITTTRLTWNGGDTRISVDVIDVLDGDRPRPDPLVPDQEDIGEMLWVVVMPIVQVANRYAGGPACLFRAVDENPFLAYDPTPTHKGDPANCEHCGYYEKEPEWLVPVRSEATA